MVTVKLDVSKFNRAALEKATADGVSAEISDDESSEESSADAGALESAASEAYSSSSRNKSKKGRRGSAASKRRGSAHTSASASAAAHAAANADPFPTLFVPEAYRRIVRELTEQERVLLDKYSRSKKLTLQVSVAKQQQAIALHAKRQDQLKRRNSTMHAAQDTKRPRTDDDARGADAKHMSASPPPHARSGIAAQREDPRVLMSSDWHSMHSREPLILDLHGLRTGGEGGNNTLLISATLPLQSRRFCFNVSPHRSYKEEDPSTVFLYQFNPRVEGRNSHIVQRSFANNRWSNPDKSLDKLPITPGRRFELRIAVRPDAFLTALDGKVLSVFPHRVGEKYLADGATLHLIVPLQEAHYGDKENIIVHRVWWGPAADAARASATSSSSSSSSSSSAAAAAATAAPGQPRRSPFASGASGALRPPGGQTQFQERTLHVAGLPRDNEAARAELQRLFRNYKVEGEVRVIMDGRGVGFVKLSSESELQDAIKNLHRAPGAGGQTLSVERARQRRPGGGSRLFPNVGGGAGGGRSAAI